MIGTFDFSQSGRKGFLAMPRSKSKRGTTRRISTAQFVFLILTVVIILSFVLSLIVNV